MLFILFLQNLVLYFLPNESIRHANVFTSHSNLREFRVYSIHVYGDGGVGLDDGGAFTVTMSFGFGATVSDGGVVIGARKLRDIDVIKGIDEVSVIGAAVLHRRTSWVAEI